MKGLVLASRSASRAAILEHAGVAFTVVESGVDEQSVKAAAAARGGTPRSVARALAARKATVVSASCPDLVLGADQTLEVEGRLYDKVETLEEARDRLRFLRGRRHSLHSAVAFARSGRVVRRMLRSATLAMREFSDEFLGDYLAKHGREALAASGCYFLEDVGAQLFEHVSGDYFTILGLPLLPVLGFLRSEGVVAT